MATQLALQMRRHMHAFKTKSVQGVVKVGMPAKPHKGRTMVPSAVSKDVAGVSHLILHWWGLRQMTEGVGHFLLQPLW